MQSLESRILKTENIYKIHFIYIYIYIHTHTHTHTYIEYIIYYYYCIFSTENSYFRASFTKQGN